MGVSSQRSTCRVRLRVADGQLLTPQVAGYDNP